MNSPNVAKNYVLGIVGAAVGGLVGYFAYVWIVKQGFYAPLVPPAAVGFGAGIAARRRLIPLGVFCAIAGLALGLFVEWDIFPFNDDQSFTYFITHVHRLTPLTLILLAVGAFFSYRLATGFDRGSAASE
jgi:hypothetical protein